MKKELDNIKIKYNDILKNKKLILNKKQSSQSIHKENSIIIDSKIINNNQQYLKSLLNWINPNKSIKTELLYRLSKDGDLFKTFHEKCDNIFPTLIIVQASNGRKFGGYTTLNWSLDSNDLIDNNTFLFSFDENKKYPKKKMFYEDIQKGSDTEYGPYFGQCDLLFKGNMKTCKSYYYEKYNFLDSNILAKNTVDSFSVAEVEIYKIIEL